MALLNGTTVADTFARFYNLRVELVLLSINRLVLVELVGVGAST